MPKRFDETVNIQGLSTTGFRSGGAEASMSLVDRLESFKQKGFARAEQQAVQRGTESGQSVALERDEQGLTKAPEFKEEKFIGGISMRAHNKALGAAYLSSLNNDNREAIGRISAANPENIIGFNEEIESYRKGVISSVEPGLRAGIAQDLDNKITSARIRVQANDVQRQNKEAENILKTGAEQSANAAFSATRNGDTVLAGEEQVSAFAEIDALVTNGSLDLDDANRQKRGITREVAEQGIRRDIDPMEPEEQLAKIDELSKTIPKGWTPDEWDGFMDDLNRDANRGMSARNATDKLLIEDDSVQKRLLGDDTQVLSSKAVDRVYDEQFAQADNGQRAFFVDRTKTVPTALRKQINSDMLTGNPDVIIGSLDMMNRIDNVPGLANAFTPEFRAFTDTVGELSKNLEPREAVKIAKEQTDPRNVKRIEAADQQIAGLVKDGDLDYEADVESVVERGFFNENVLPSPVNEANMVAEYKTLVDTHFRAGMTLDSAKETAEQLMQRNWKDEDFLGRVEARKYPMKDYYAVEGSIQYLESQLLNDVADSIFTPDALTKDNIFLLSDDRTGKEAALGTPTYLVFIRNDNGLIESSGQRFRPDMQEGLDKRDESLKAMRKKNLEDKAAISFQGKGLQ